MLKSMHAYAQVDQLAVGVEVWQDGQEVLLSVGSGDDIRVFKVHVKVMLCREAQAPHEARRPQQQPV